MKLIIPLFLVIAPIILCSTTYKVLGDLPKHSTKSFYPFKEGDSCCYCINLSDFPKGSGLYFKVTLTYGQFSDTNMHIGGSNEKISTGNTLTLSTPITYEYYSSTRNAYYFYIANPGDFNYLYVASPAYGKYDSNSLIAITNTIGPTYFVLGDLQNYGRQSFYPSEKGKHVVYCINTDNFKNDKYISISTTINSGRFAHEMMYYGGYDSQLSIDAEVTLSSYVSSRSSSDYTFNVPKTGHKYLYVAPPPPYTIEPRAYITIENIFSVTYKVLGELSKYSEKSFAPSDKGIYCAYYIRADNFPNNDHLYFEVSLNSGSFEHNKMYYIVSNTKYSENTELTFYSEPSYAISSNNTFIVPKNSYTYLYVAPPPPYTYNSQTKITISNLYRPYKIKYNILRELHKSGKETFKPYYDGIYCAYYIKLDDFEDEDNLLFKVEKSSGIYEHEYMFYGYLNKELDNETTIILPSNTYPDTSGNYKIPKSSSYKYLYFAPPPVINVYSNPIITVYNIFQQSYKLLEELPKFGEKSFVPYEKGKYCSYFIKMDDFPRDRELYFNVSITSGSFNYEVIYYGFADEKFTEGKKITLPNNQSYSFYSGKEYNFILTKSSRKYLYIAPSPPSNYDSKTKITISNLYRAYKIKYNILGELLKNSNETFKPFEHGIYSSYYIKLDDLPDNSILNFKVELSSGIFEHEYMFYGYLDKELDNETVITLPSNVRKDSSGIYKIKKSSFKYLYFAPPPPVDNYDRDSSITVYNTGITQQDDDSKKSETSTSSSSNKLAIGLGVGIPCFVILVVVIIIVAYKSKNRGVSSSSIDSKFEPIHLNGSKY